MVADMSFDSLKAFSDLHAHGDVRGCCAIRNEFPRANSRVHLRMGRRCTADLLDARDNDCRHSSLPEELISPAIGSFLPRHSRGASLHFER
jgi:hypothetical protein